ncbi:hypothetical protein ABZ698_37690, partial [Streptomyces antibioticus]
WATPCSKTPGELTGDRSNREPPEHRRFYLKLSLVLILVGLWVRSRVSESPVFERWSTDNVHVPRLPLGTLTKRHPGKLLLGIGAAVGGSTLYYLTIAYSLSYGPALGMLSDVRFVHDGVVAGVVGRHAEGPAGGGSGGAWC